MAQKQLRSDYGLVQRSFAAGEIAPALGARSDTTRYQSGLSIVRNFFVLRHGGIANRPGLRHVSVTPNNLPVRMIPFVFSASQAYNIVLSDHALRIIASKVHLAPVTSGNWAYGSYTAGAITTYSGNLYHCAVGHTTTSSSQHPESTVGVAQWHKQPSTLILELATPYAQADLADITFKQSGDVLTLMHGGYPTHELRRYSNTLWTMLPADLIPFPGPVGITATEGGTGSEYTILYKVTAVKAKTYEESLPGIGIALSGTAFPNSGLAHAIPWVAGAHAVGEYVSSAGYGYVCKVAVLAPGSSAPISATGYWTPTTDVAAGLLDIVVWTTTAHGLVTGDRVTFSFALIGNPTAVLLSGKSFAVTVINTILFTLDDTSEIIAESSAPGSVGLPYARIIGCGIPSATVNNHKLEWPLVAGAGEYWVYRCVFATGVIAPTYTFRYLESTESLTWNDTFGIAEGNVAETPPIANNPFGITDEYPSCGCFFQQRSVFAGSRSRRRTVWMSRASNLYNFTTTSPTKANDSIEFTLVGDRVQDMVHCVDLGNLVLLTDGTEWAALGDGTGTITPVVQNPQLQSRNGAARRVTPWVIDRTLVYAQARGSLVRSLSFDFQADGYSGSDLTVFSPHLVDGYTLLDSALALREHSQIFFPRDDGIMLSLTYEQAQQIVGWTRYDTAGTFDAVCSIPEGIADVTYVSTTRTVNGSTVRHIEVFEPRMAGYAEYDLDDAWFLDDGSEYVGSTTIHGALHISGSGAMGAAHTLTGSGFAGSDIGLGFRLTGSDGLSVEVVVVVVGGAGSVTVIPLRAVPASVLTAVASYVKLSYLISATQLEAATVGVTSNGLDMGTVVVASGLANLGVGAPATYDFAVGGVLRHAATMTSGLAYTYSVYARVEDGLGTVNINLNTDNGASSLAVADDGAWHRIKATSNASVTYHTYADIEQAAGATVTRRVSLMWAQLEQATSATLYVPTFATTSGANLLTYSALMQASAAWTVAAGSVTAVDLARTDNPTSCGLGDHLIVGLPYTCDAQTLSIEPANVADATDDKLKLVKRVALHVDSSGTFSAGPPDGILDEYNPEPGEGPLLNGKVYVNIDSSWEQNGRVLVRQSAPLPLTILSITPVGVMGGR